jgi:hypothetical protein
VAAEAATATTAAAATAAAKLGWEIDSEFCRIPQLIQFRTF